MPVAGKGGAKDRVEGLLGGNIRKKVQLAFEADIALKKKELEKMRKEEQKALIKGGNKEAFGNVLYPKYQYDERLKIDREVEPPPASLFKEIGFDPKPADCGITDPENKHTHKRLKHYRRYYPDELENVKDEKGDGMLIESPFLTEKITRASLSKSGGLLAGLFGSAEACAADMTVQEVGDFKGICRCYNESLLLERKEEVS